ncbi:MAG TPA: AbrB/MazE/SpoVT family DNA-binding domain-containing protein [Thermoplasmata archaeon]|nr:AbrB/MazE/SpoVT family DNA-binding domain-containing protein [Thermoplasmata archaeon]
MAWGTPNRERRVLKAGHSSIAVTLPKPWAEAMNLRPGDLVVFDQNDDGTLYLKPAPSAGSNGSAAPYLVQAPSFDTDGVLQRLIIGAYRAGHDAIEIRTDVALGPERVEEVVDAARGLLGVSVVAQEPNRVVLQNFIDPSKYGLPQLVQRMKMILVAFLDEMEEVVRRHARSRRRGTLEEEAKKVLSLLVRQLFLASRDWGLARRIGSPDPRQLLEWRVVVHALEELASYYGEALELLNEEADKLGEATASGFAARVPELKDRLKDVVDALMQRSLERACEVYQGGGNGARRPAAARRGLGPGRGPASARLARHLLERSALCVDLLAELAIDRAVAAGTETVLVEAA